MRILYKYNTTPIPEVIKYGYLYNLFTIDDSRELTSSIRCLVGTLCV